MKGLSIWFVLVTYGIALVHPYKITMDPEILKNKLEDLGVYSLKTKEMQAHMDKISFRDVRAIAKDLLKELVEFFEEEFRKRVVIVKRLRAAVEIALTTTNEDNLQPCCTNDYPYTFEARFRTRVSLDAPCEVFIPTLLGISHHLNRYFTEMCIQNLKDLPSLKWQYFASEFGVTTVYPGPRPPSCAGKDTRSKSWYVQAVSPQTKEIVILIDKSGSMSETHLGVARMDLAKDVAKVIVGTLSPDDKVAVVAMSDNQETLSDYSKNRDCFRTMMAQVTPQTKSEIGRFINGLNANGGSYFSKALNKSFEFFLSEYNPNTTTARVLHFISDGFPNDSPKDILKILREKNAQLGNSVRVLTYGLGEPEGDQRDWILPRIATDNPIVSKRGEYFPVTDPIQLRSELSATYKLYAANTKITEPTWIVPYLDSGGVGQLLTASLPVYLNGELMGIVAVDVSLEDLLSKARFFKPNEFTYSFVIDGRGLLINHPLFPYVEDNNSLFVSATAFERDPEFKEIMDSMLRGEKGSKTLNSTKTISHGDSKRYGVTTKDVQALYIWQRIPNTTFSVCVVVVGDTYKVLDPQGNVPPGSFIYHRFDLVPPKQVCKHLNSYTAKENNSIMIPSRAFVDPTYYFRHNFNSRDVEHIKNYMEGSGPNVNHIKEGIKDEVVVTNEAAVLWSKVDENTILRSHVLYRYLATQNGVYRIFPGIQLSRFYDPTTRPWFEHGIANRAKTSSLVSPYKNPGHNMGVVTLTHVLFKGSSSGVADPETDEIFGVMGMDLQLNHFQDLFLKWYPDCNNGNLYRCYLIDKGGFIIVTNNIDPKYGDLNALFEDYNWEAHISQMEPDIAKEMIQDNVLQRINCSNIEAGLIQRAYMISDDQGPYSGSLEKSVFDVFNFKMIPVPETNTFLLVRLLFNSGCSFHSFSCQCAHAVTDETSKITCITDGLGAGNCECPCAASDPHYIPCKNEYVISSDSPPPCTPPKRSVVVEDEVVVREISEDQVEECYKTSFAFQDEPPTTYISIVVGAIFGSVFLSVVWFCGYSIRHHKERERRKKMMKNALVGCRTYKNIITARVRKSIAGLSKSSHENLGKKAFKSVESSQDVKDQTVLPTESNKKISIVADPVEIEDKNKKSLKSANSNSQFMKSDAPESAAHVLESAHCNSTPGFNNETQLKISSHVEQINTNSKSFFKNNRPYDTDSSEAIPQQSNAFPNKQNESVVSESRLSMENDASNSEVQKLLLHPGHSDMLETDRAASTTHSVHSTSSIERTHSLPLDQSDLTVHVATDSKPHFESDPVVDDWLKTGRGTSGKSLDAEEELKSDSGKQQE